MEPEKLSFAEQSPGRSQIRELSEVLLRLSGKIKIDEAAKIETTIAQAQAELFELNRVTKSTLKNLDNLCRVYRNTNH
jgi:hypothetical protein